MFPRHILESLRAPLEDGRVRIARSGGLVTYPSRFALVAAMNPCPCGYHLDERRACSCHPGDRQRYARKLSGPLLDRFDLLIGMQRPTRGQLLTSDDGERSRDVRVRVQAARQIQVERHGSSATNASVSRAALREHAHLEPAGLRLLGSAVDSALLSARGLDKVLRVARTIADLAGTHSVSEAALAEAISLRVSADHLGSAA